MPQKIKSKFEKIKNILTLEAVKISAKRKFQILMKVFLISALVFIKTKIELLPIKFNESVLIQIIDILLLFLVIYLISNLTRSIIVSLYRRKHNLGTEQHDNLIIGIDKIFQLLTYLTIFFLALYNIGIDFNNFMTTFGLFAVGTAMIFKELISNVIYGMIIMFTNEIKLKEIIQIGEYKGKIIDINFLNVELKTGDGNIVFVPNSKILNTEIINYSKSKIKTIRNEFYLDFGFFGKIDKLEEEISKELELQFKEISGLNSVELKIDEIRFNRVKINLLITVSRYTLSIDSKISKFASRYILEFVNKHKSLKSKSTTKIVTK